MSQIQNIGGQPEVRAAIARAARASGVDFDYLLAQAKIESNLNPQARAGTSSASGLYQFTSATWLQTLARHGSEFGLPNLADPAGRAQAMALRFDPQASALMAASLASDNKASLTTALGHAPDASELYLAHFLGADGATKFLNALASDPAQSAAALMPAAAAANHGIFSRADGSARSVGEVMGLIRAKMGAAMEGSPYSSGEGAGGWGLSEIPGLASNAMPHPGPSPKEEGLRLRGPIAQEFASAAPPQRSMAQVIEQAFALGTPGASALPEHVRAAYAKLSAMGL